MSNANFHIGTCSWKFPAWRGIVYLNKQMVASQDEFLERLDTFARQLPAGHAWCVETRNPNWLNEAYFHFLKEREIGHVWEQGYYMPAVAEV